MHVNPFTTLGLAPQFGNFFAPTDQATSDAKHTHKIEAEQSKGHSPDELKKVLNDQIVSALEKELSQTSEPSIYTLDAVDFTPAKVADRILSFVALGLQRSGGDSAQQQAMLDRAREGVEKGFNEAKDILTSLGAFNGDVADNADKTYNLLQQGLDQFANRLGQNQTVLATTPGQASHVERFSQTSMASQQSLNLKITTSEGDVVDLQISLQQAATSTRYSRTDTGSRYDALEQSSSQQSNYSLVVDGDLNADELAAITSLVNDIGKLSNQFFSGDVQSAFKEAQKLSLDSTQLSELSLRMSDSIQLRAANAYRQTNDLDNSRGDNEARSNSLQKPLHEFLTSFNNVAQQATALPLRDAERFFSDLFVGLPYLERSDGQNIDLTDKGNGVSLADVTASLLNAVNNNAII